MLSHIISFSNQLKTIAIIAISFICVKIGYGQLLSVEANLESGLRASSNYSAAVFAESNMSEGVFAKSNTYYGIHGKSSSNVGVYATSISFYALGAYSVNGHGSYFRGDKENGFADIILAGSSSSSTGDNGVIRSDPIHIGSDIFLEANDAIVAKIDRNNTGAGNFFVWDGNNTNLFQVTLDGTVLVKGTTVHGSDRNRKEQITDVSYPKILEAIKEMPIYEWQYIGQDRRHIGPMAQDFHKAFGLGDDEKTLASIDADGVALAAIKAQQEIIEKQEERNSLYEAEINSLKQKIDELQLMKEDIALLKAMISERKAD